MVVRVLCSIVLVSIFHLFHYVQCQGGQCSRLKPRMHPELLVNGICIHFDVKVRGFQRCNVSGNFKHGKIHRSEKVMDSVKGSALGDLRAWEDRKYCFWRAPGHPTSDSIVNSVTVGMLLMANMMNKAKYVPEKKCLEFHHNHFFGLWLNSTSISTTTSSATTTSTTTTPTPTTTTTTTTTTPTTTTTTTTPTPTTTTTTTTTTPTTTTTTTTTTSITTMSSTTTTFTTTTTTKIVDTTTTASPTTTTALSTFTSTVPYVTETTTVSIEPLITTTVLSTSTEVSELSSIDQGGINETVVISPEREKEYIRIQRKRVLDSAKLKLLVISTLMTTGLSIQLLLIRQLRKLLREWYESGLLVEDGVANAVVRMAAKKMKSAGRKGMKQKRKGALARAKKFGRKPKIHRDSNRTPKKRSAKVARSKNVSSDDITTDLYNFYGGKQKGSRDSFSKESSRSRDASSEGKSKDSKEEHGKKRSISSNESS